MWEQRREAARMRNDNPIHLSNLWGSRLLWCVLECLKGVACRCKGVAYGLKGVGGQMWEQRREAARMQNDTSIVFRHLRGSRLFWCVIGCLKGVACRRKGSPAG